MLKKFYSDFKVFFGDTKCIACNEDITNKISFFKRVWLDDFSRQNDIYVCGNCGLAYSYPLLTDAEQRHLYINYPHHFIHEKILRRKISMVLRIQIVFENFLDRVFLKNGNVVLRKFLSSFLFQRVFQSYPLFYQNNGRRAKILDIGCGDGDFLSRAQKFGWECYGVEYQEDLVRRLDDKGIKAATRIEHFLAESSKNSEKFNLIRMNQVLEHVIDPNIILRDAYKLLERDGELIVGVPNFNTLAKLFGENFWLHLPFHRYHFSISGIVKLIERNGFKITYVRTKSIGIFTGSFRRKFKDSRWAAGIVRLLDAFFLSIFLDLFKCGDCIEVHAKK